METLSFLKFAAYLIIFGALWRLLTAYFADTPLGSAMAAIY